MPANAPKDEGEETTMRNAECGMRNCGEAQAQPAGSDGEAIGAERVDRSPGFDSIRPGQNKCGTRERALETCQGAPFDEYGTQIALAEGDWAQGALYESMFCRHDQIRPFNLQPIEMSNAEAIEALTHIEADIYGRIAISKAIDALGPWVKTADRLPEDREMLNGCVPIVDERGYGSVQKRQVLERYPRDYPWWLPLPALPEKADGTPVIARRDYPQKPTSGLIEEDA